MLDYTKITFNELDDTDKPLQAFYNYDLKESEIDSFLEEYATVEEVPEGVSIQKVELCLTIYAQHDFKLEACCTDTNNEQYWVEINKQFTNADEFIQMIPDYGKIKIVRKEIYDMRIHTVEEDYEYRMKNIMQKFVKDYELEGLSAEELQDKMWSEYSKEFAHAVLQDMNDFSGDELFEIGE